MIIIIYKVVTLKYLTTLWELWPSGPKKMTFPPLFIDNSWNHICKYEKNNTSYLRIYTSVYLIKSIKEVNARLMNGTSNIPYSSTLLWTIYIRIETTLTSKPEVCSTMKIIKVFATRYTTIVNLFFSLVYIPVTLGRPTITSFNFSSSTSSMTSSTMAYKLESFRI